MQAEVAVGVAGAVIVVVAVLAVILRRRGSAARPVTRLVLGDIPGEPPSAVGRGALLARIDETFAEGRFCVLLGGSGAGKTQLAAAYARAAVAGERTTVVWVAAEDPAGTVRAYAELARRAGQADVVVDAEAAARTGMAWLDSLERPVVVLDSATDPDALIRWLPARARVLVTTTVPDFEILGGTVAVSGFDEAEAAGFLCARSGRAADRATADVVRELGCLPLALAQAAGVVRRQRLSFASYLERLPHALLERVPGEGYPARVEDTALEALRAVAARDGRARTIAEFLALLATRGVRRALVHRAGPDPVAVDAALGALAEASLAGFDVTGDVVTMHRLTQRAVLGRLHAEERLAPALSRVLDVADTDDSTLDVVDHAAALWRHFRALSSAELAPLLDRILRLRRRSVTRLLDAGALAEARALGWEVLADHDAYLPADDERAERAAEALRRACLLSERAREAVTLSERILDRRLRVLGLDAEPTVEARTALGAACEEAGLLDRALDLHRANLAHATRVLGPGHRATLDARLALGRSLRSAGLFAEAVPVFEESVRAHDPPSADARGELARAYVDAGRVEDGIALYERDDSPRWARHRAAAYQAAGRYDDAIGLLRAAAAHPADGLDAIDVRLGLASALLDAGRVAEALELFERTVADRTRILGPDHSGTLDARRLLGLARSRAGETEEARETLTAVAADHRRVLGAEHPRTRRAGNDLAGLPDPGQRRRVRR